MGVELWIVFAFDSELSRRLVVYDYVLFLGLPKFVVCRFV